MWNPWAALADLTHVALRFERDLEDGAWGLTIFGARPTILLHAGLTQAQRRCTLAHELVHVERGPVPAPYVAREEAAVDQVAARRLITHEQLADALAWSCDEHQVAEQLHVDVDTVLARLRGLSDAESADLVARLDDAELRLP